MQGYLFSFSFFLFLYHVQPVAMIYFIHGYSFSSSFFFGGGGGVWGGGYHVELVVIIYFIQDCSLFVCLLLVPCTTGCDHLHHPMLLFFVLGIMYNLL